MEETIQLAEWFVLRVVQAQGGTGPRIERAIHAIEKLIQQGWTLQDLQFEIEDFAKTYPQIVTSIYHLEEIIGNKKPPNNLLDPDVFYYHTLLREVPPPTRIKFENGQAIREEQNFYLEMKKRFTMQDLLEYWYKHNDVKPNDHMLKQDEGKLKYILGFYTVDEILFAIDVSRAIRKGKQQLPLRNIFDLERYMDDARKFLEGKKNIHQLEGINRVIQKEG